LGCEAGGKENKKTTLGRIVSTTCRSFFLEINWFKSDVTLFEGRRKNPSHKFLTDQNRTENIFKTHTYQRLKEFRTVLYGTSF